MEREASELGIGSEHHFSNKVDVAVAVDVAVLDMDCRHHLNWSLWLSSIAMS